MGDRTPDVILPNGFRLPAELSRRLARGGRAASWMATVPAIVRDWCERWEITLEPHVPTLSYNLVLFGTSRLHGQVVLKVAPPDPETRAEIEATAVARGPGLVRLIGADPDAAIMLLKRVQPGTPLRQLTESGAISDEEATRLAARMMSRVWATPPPQHHLVPLARWFQALFAYRHAHPDGNGPLPPAIVDRAVAEARTLLATQDSPVVLHGDVHHDNLLADEVDGWTLIDFKGLVGERGYDVGTWMLNPPGLESWPDLADRLARRLEILAAELRLPQHRLWQWSLAHAVLSACWSLEDGDGSALPALRVAETIVRLEPGDD